MIPNGQEYEGKGKTIGQRLVAEDPTRAVKDGKSAATAPIQRDHGRS